MSTAAKVELYISKRPYIREALAEGVVNYSSLARKIKEEKEIKSEAAAKAAISRYEKVVARQKSQRKKEMIKILENTSINIQSNVEVVLADAQNAIVSAKTSNGYTSVVPGNGKALVSLESPSSLEKTPGVIEFILSSIAARGINVDHLISCREDTHLVVDKNDAPNVLEILQDRLN